MLRLFSLIILFLSACSGPVFPTYVKIEGLRVFTLLADKSEAHPGDSVTIRPLVSDWFGNGSITFTYSYCLDPGVSLGLNPECPAGTVLGSATGVVSFDTAADPSASDRTGATQTFTVTVPPAASAFASRSPVSQFNGVPLLILYTLQNASGDSVVAFKRVLIVNPTLRASTNSNPTLSGILVDGSPYSTFPFSRTVQLLAVASGAESYPALTTTGELKTQQEVLQTTWFYTDGELKYYRTLEGNSTEYKAGDNPGLNRFAHLLVVTRDSRGGQNFLHYRGH